ncbi:MAG: NADH-quinone oxidoreductase subunit NuoN [Neisseriaceae bacterium]
MNINILPVLPEIFLAFMIIVLLFADAFISESKKHVITMLTIITIVVTFIIQFMVYSGKPELTFNNMFVLDILAQGMKLTIYIVSLIIVLYIKQYINDKNLHKGEFYAIFLFSLLGMMVMISANSMLVLYIGLELLSLGLCALIALNRDNVKSTEAAMKYFILSALASGLLLFGISFVYGATGGQLQLDLLFRTIYSNVSVNNQFLSFGLVFIVAGLVFKLGLVPFHMWIPDIYEGSSLATTTIIGTVTKIAAVIFMIRFLIYALVTLSNQWAMMLMLLGIFSLFIGNVVAIAQTNIKRMLGYSAIANMGFIAFGFITVSSSGISAMLFYTIIYVLTALAGFGVLTMLSRGNYECENIDDLKGLSKTYPIHAGILLLVMFSLAGIPPLAGFYAKFRILEELIAVGYIKIAIYTVIMSLIGAFYYLRIVKVMYFDESIIELRLADVCIVSRSVLIINGVLLIALGVIPGGVIAFCLKMITG